MAHKFRFYLKPNKWQKPYILENEEVHHFINVLRGQKGAKINLFDGQGREGIFIVTNITKRQLDLELISEKLVKFDAPKICLAIGWNKSMRRGYCLEKAVELGAHSIWFWQAQYSQGRLPTEGKDLWTPTLIAAAKQCGTSFLPEIKTFSSLDSLISEADNFSKKILLWEEKRNETQILAPTDFETQNSIVIIGPEGGLNKKEVECCQDANFLCYSLGNTILRWETAVIYVLSLGKYMKECLIKNKKK